MRQHEYIWTRCLIWKLGFRGVEDREIHEIKYQFEQIITAIFDHFDVYIASLS